MAQGVSLDEGPPRSRPLVPARNALREDPAPTPHLREGLDCTGHVLWRVRGGELDADARLPFRNDGVAEPDDVDALGEQVSREIRGEARIAEHDGDDGVEAGLRLEARALHLVAKRPRVLHEPIAK